MKKFFTYFGFNQAEQRGFIGFIFLIILIIVVPSLIKHWSQKESIHYDLVYLDQKPKERNSLNSFKENVSKSEGNNKSRSVITYFTFDPNTLDENSWVRLGFTEKQIKVIMNYRSKGGRFYKKEDLAKIYSISASDYTKIAPYIRIENPNKKESTNEASAWAVKPTDNRSLVIDINTSDTIVWQKLHGIGSVLSKRIVKYRDALGGFHSTEQVKEVYGLPAETFDNIRSNLKVDPAFRIQKININSCSEDELIRHPYFNKKQVKTIINYRNQHGKFVDLESLSQIKSLDSIFLRKIEDYLEY